MRRYGLKRRNPRNRRKFYRRNSDTELRELEREHSQTNDPELWARIQRVRKRLGLCPHYKVHCDREYYGNYEDSGTHYQLLCNECGEVLRGESVPSWEDYGDSYPDWCYDNEDEDWFPARNPLKKSAFEKKLKKLKKLGIEQMLVDEISRDFNSEFNDSSHSLYITDWLTARLALLKFLEDEKDAYVSILANYRNMYKIDAHDLSLDGALQIDHYNSLRHYAHLAQTNPYFRLPWPKHLHKITYTDGYHWSGGRRVPREFTVVGEVREWDSVSQMSRPAVKILSGANRAVSDTQSLRIEKDTITNIEEKSDPESLIAFLKDVEDNVESSRFFEPVHHESATLMSFPDGKAWVVIREEDVEAEGSSLRDCARAENRKTILLSLREPVTKTHVQALLKAEVVFPTLSKEPSLEEIKDNKGIIVQLRGYRNSKPSPEMHPYILPLLKQKWIVHLVEPNYQSANTFILGDLEPEIRKPLRKRKLTLFSAKSFYNKYKLLPYPSRIKENILNKIDMPVSEIHKILSAKRYNTSMRRKALSEFRKRLDRGNKNKRGELFRAAETLLYSTKNKSFISDIFDVFRGYKRQSSLFIEFFKIRADWLLEERNTGFFLRLIKESLPLGEGGYNPGKRLSKGVLEVLRSIKEDHSEFIIKLLFETKFDVHSMRNIRMLLEEVLGMIIDVPSRLTSDLCNWYQDESTGWGRHEHRSFVNQIPLSRKLLAQFKELIKLSVERGDDCYMDLAITIAERMSADDKDKLLPLYALLTKSLISGNRRVRREAYKHLGRIVDRGY